MNFSTLQRPTFEDLERRRQMREDGPGPGKGIQRKDSVLARGINALRRRQSMISARKPEHVELQFSGQPFRSLGNPEPQAPLSMMTTESSNARRQSYNFPQQPRPGLNRSRSVLARARSFKHPERISQIPPMEITRLRSKSQVRDAGSSSSGVFSYGDDSGDGLYAGFSSSASPPSSSGRLRSGYQSMAEVMAYRNASNGPSWAQNTASGRPDANNNLGRSTSVKPAHMRAGFFANRPRRRDLSEPTPPPPVPPVVMPSGREPVARRRRPLPDIFYYGNEDTNDVEGGVGGGRENIDER